MTAASPSPLGPGFVDAAAIATPRAVHVGAIRALLLHWPEYLMEAAELALFMISACLVTALLEHPASPVHQLLPSNFFRRFLTGMAMAATAIAIIYSPWGKRSGAHFNPAVTLTFLRLKKIEVWDAVFYALAQFGGGIAGVLLSTAAIRMAISHPSVNYAATVPGSSGKAIAFIAEAAISFLLMLTVLVVSNNKILSRYTPLFSGFLVATYITFEAPLSGMSMNPARTLGSAVLPELFENLWIYFLAPPIGMLLAAELYVRLRSLQRVYCAKFHHHNSQRCIFLCRFSELVNGSETTTGN